MADTTRIEIELDDSSVEKLGVEADRLGISVNEVAQRALAAWLNDMAEGEENGRA